VIPVATIFPSMRPPWARQRDGKVADYESQASGTATTAPLEACFRGPARRETVS